MTTETFWTKETIVMLGLLGCMVISACLPAAVCFRSRKNGKGVACLVLGATGAFLFVPWVIAMVLGLTDNSFCDREESGTFRKVGKLIGGILLALGVICLILAMKDYAVIKENTMYMQFLKNSVINGIVGSVFLCVIGVVTFLCGFARGKGFWGWYMALPYLMVNGGEVMSQGRFPVFVHVLLIAGAAYIWWNVCRSVRRETGAAASAMSDLASSVRKTAQAARTVRTTERAAGRIRCLTGEYAGAEFPMEDGEALCFGSDPSLAHLIFPARLAAPLHMEISYQKERGNYLLAHSQDCPVFLKEQGRVREEIRELPAGTEVSFGAGDSAQTFLLL